MRAPNPPTRVDDVVIFPNGEWRKLSKKELRVLDRYGELVVPMPPRNPWREIVYGPRDAA